MDGIRDLRELVGHAKNEIGIHAPGLHGLAETVNALPIGGVDRSVNRKRHAAMAKRGQIVHSLTYPCRVIDAGLVGILRDMSQALHEREPPVFYLHRTTGFSTGARAEDATATELLPPPPNQGYPQT